MTTTTVIFEGTVTDYERFKAAFDGGNEDRQENTGTGHTMARDVNDPNRIRVVVSFDDLAGANEWATTKGAPEVLDSILDKAGLAERPHLWIGENIEQIHY